LLYAVSYCHSHRVVHRDIKPENILLITEGKKRDVKICDFGASAFFDAGQKLTGAFGSIYYLAPEVLDEVYNEKCDLWSLGVVMYILLSGKAPFNGKSCGEIKEKIRDGTFAFAPERDWVRISANAKDLISKLLQKKVRQRISADEALHHPWIEEFLAKSREELPDLGETSLIQLKEFNSISKLKDAIYGFIAAQIMSHSETKDMREAFRKIDKNGDGTITQDELLDEYTRVLGAKEAVDQVASIMAQIDIDHSGKIEYTEFIAASI
jgi:calcium-dependent protein kinase